MPFYIKQQEFKLILMPFYIKNQDYNSTPKLLLPLIAHYAPCCDKTYGSERTQG